MSPLLRGARGERYSEENHSHKLREHIYREIHCDGLVELGHLSTYHQEREILSLSPAYPLILFANLIAQAHRVRNQAGVPMAEYAVEVEIHVRGVPAIVPWNKYRISSGKLAPGMITFPRYSFGDSDEGNDLLNLFYRDFWNSFGKDIDTDENELEIPDWTS